METTTPEEETSYQVFLLRVWRECAAENESTPVWRFSLESPTNHHRRGFDSLEALMAFLSNQTGREKEPRSRNPQGVLFKDTMEGKE